MGSDANYWFRESTEHLLPRRVRSKHQQQRQHESLLAEGLFPICSIHRSCTEPARRYAMGAWRRRWPRQGRCIPEPGRRRRGCTESGRNGQSSLWYTAYYPDEKDRSAIPWVASIVLDIISFLPKGCSKTRAFSSTCSSTIKSSTSKKVSGYCMTTADVAAAQPTSKFYKRSSRWFGHGTFVVAIGSSGKNTQERDNDDWHEDGVKSKSPESQVILLTHHVLLFSRILSNTTPMTGTTIREPIIRFPRQTLSVSKGFTRLPYDIMRLLALI